MTTEPPRVCRTSVLRSVVASVVWVAVATAVCSGCGGCERRTRAEDHAADHDDVAFELEALEQSLRPAVAERVLRGARRALGGDPVKVAVLPDDTVAVLLRGAETLLVLDGARVVATLPVGGPGSALAVDGDTLLFASSTSGVVQRVRSLATLPISTPVSTPVSVPVDGVSALAARGDFVDVGGVDGDVVTLRGAAVLGRCPVGLGLAALVRLPRHLVALSALGHRVVVFPLDDDGVPRCLAARVERFDGLLFSLVAGEDEAGVVDVFVSGIEDQPLDRAGGSFGNIDSFAFGLRFAGNDDPARVWETNLSAVGVVTGAALVALDDTRVLVVGKGSGGRVVLDRRDGRVIEVGNGAAGVVDVARDSRGRVVAANVLDDVVTIDGVPLPFPTDGAGDGRAQERLGERLVFTTLLAPQQQSDGPRSRFTCEACHLEGGSDGRVHATGRLDEDGHAVTATTKPLFGLFQNPPLFTRGLDRSVSVMVHAEVKVANRNSAQHPWFASGDHSAEELRRAMVAFFAGFDAPPNARARAALERGTRARARLSTGLDDDEARGWQAFQQRCLSCHAPRVFADDAASQLNVGADDVVTALLRGALVFGRDGHEDTGVRPRVHPEGARSSSLRGVSHKVPLLTNGRALDLAELLSQVRLVPSTSSSAARITHQGDEGAPLSPAEQRDLLAFLRLL